jgi:starvation-inducible outer membrane lipoprotein
MALKALTLVSVALLLSSCETLTKQLERAAVTTGQTQAHFDFPDLPDACIAKVQRVIPKVGEKVRWTQSRWEITADNRDQLAADCDAWGKQAKQKYGGAR